MSIVVPTVSTSGWVTNLAEKADRLMSYYFVSDYSQTHLYPGAISSLPKQVREYGHNPLLLSQEMTSLLTQYLKPHFEDVTVNIRTDVPNPQDPNRINITVDAIVVEKGESYSLGRLISAVDSRISQIVDINNNKGG